MKGLILFIILVLSYQLFAGDLSCFPENNLEIPVSKSATGKVPGLKNLEELNTGLNEQDLQMAIDLFEKTWGPILSSKYGKNLRIQNEWKSPKVDAFTTRDDDNNPVIVIRGGLSRHPDMTVEGMLLILCHELGHHYGGAPKSFRGNTQLRGWSSAEGQADYFAANKCMPKILSESYVYKMQTQVNDIDKACTNDFCKKMVPAALSVGKVFSTLRSDWTPPVVGQRSDRRVNQTVYKHPQPQCRFDTFIAGALCSSEYEQDFDDSDHRIGSCILEVQPEAARPQCWFSAEDY